MHPSHLREMVEERLLAGGGQHRHAVLLSLAIADVDLVAREVDVLDAQVQALQQPEPAAVQEPAHEEDHAVHVGEQLPRFVPGQNHRQAGGPLGADDALEQADLPLQDVPVEEDEGAQGLRLGRGADVLLIAR